MTGATREAGHTPGPWTYEATNGEDGVEAYAVTLYGRNATTKIGYVSTDAEMSEQDANASLIAAAPALLAALVGLEGWVRSLSEQSDASAADWLARLRSDHNAECRAARSAIALARATAEKGAT